MIGQWVRRTSRSMFVLLVIGRTPSSANFELGAMTQTGCARQSSGVTPSMCFCATEFERHLAPVLPPNAVTGEAMNR